ncbi:MAG: hypothetical protein HYR74_04430, partial [Candidatus Eisenbacteria bacterium]|nr:hypothetical protein [Candidatus Eisenbacteria bacterium]
MSEPRDVGRRARWAVWLAALGACTLWLVVQNTILLAALAWAEPAGVISVGGALVRAGFVVGARCWPLVAIALGA